MEEIEFKFRVGNLVSVVNNLAVYSCYLEWAKEYFLKDWKNGSQPNNDDVMRIIRVGKKEFDNREIYGCERLSDGQHFIMAGFGLVLLRNEKEEKNLEWNIVCSKCGSKAYQGFVKIECSNKLCE